MWATPPYLRGRAGKDFTVPLPGMPKANWQRFRRSGAVPSGSRYKNRRERDAVLSRGGKRQSDRVPLLPCLRVDGLLGSGSDAGLDCGRRRGIRRSGFSGARIFSLGTSAASLGQDARQPADGPFELAQQHTWTPAFFALSRRPYSPTFCVQCCLMILSAADPQI